MQFTSVCILEFDPHAGFKPLAWYPKEGCPGTRIKDVTKVITFLPRSLGSVSPSDYTSELDDFTILSRKVEVHGQEYLRNCFVFLVILLLGSNPQNVLAHDAYKRVVVGLASRLRIAEIECKLLSSTHEQDHLNKLLAEVFTQLNTNGRCQVSIDRSKGLWINLRYDMEPCFTEYSQIESSWVFSKTHAKQVTNGLPQYEIQENDLLVQRIWHAINGYSTVGDLLEITGLHPELARKALGLLLRNHYITRLRKFK